jgi:hypothetical protein
MSMYAYRPRRGVKIERASSRRYFSSFDRFMVMLGLAAVIAFVVDGIVTRGGSVVDSFQHLFGLVH